MPTVTKASPINVSLVNEMLALGSGQASLTSKGLNHLTKQPQAAKASPRSRIYQTPYRTASREPWAQGKGLAQGGLFPGVTSTALLKRPLALSAGTLALALQLGKVVKLLHAEEPQNQPVDRTGLEGSIQAPGERGRLGLV